MKISRFKKPTPKTCPSCGQPLALRWMTVSTWAADGVQIQQHILACPAQVNPNIIEEHFCMDWISLRDSGYSIPRGMSREIREIKPI